MTSGRVMRFAVTGNTRDERYPGDTLNHNYVEFLGKFGIIPILIPAATESAEVFTDQLDIEGLILTGGNDVSPSLYGGGSYPGCTASQLRDRLEQKLLTMAVESQWPVLGICRGLQFINVYWGGRLVTDLRRCTGNVINHAGNPHRIQIIDSRIEYSLGVSGYAVNSFHNQGVRYDDLAPCLEVFAVSDGDKLVEGIIHPKLPILGIQWHPERPGSSFEMDCKLVGCLLSKELWRDT